MSMFKQLSASKYFNLISNSIHLVRMVFIPLTIAALTFALIISPPDFLQGDSVRIMYVHVPSAWISLAIFTLISFLTIFNFIFKAKYLKIISICIAPMGLLFTALAIITGSIWGKPTWGAWWAWDARLTSMFVLMLFYTLFIFNYKFIKRESLQNKFSLIIVLLGMINSAVIKFSVEWWNTLHQPASIKINSTNAIHESMLVPLMLMLLVFLLYAALIFLMKYKTEIIKIKKANINRL